MMHTLSQRYRIAIIAMALVAPVAMFFQYNVPTPADLEFLRARVPKSFDPWRMIAEREPSQKEVDILETKAILSRTYSDGEQDDVDFSIVYAPNNRRVAHPPEVCYKGSGWEVEDTRLRQFPVQGTPFRVNRILLRKSGRRLLVLYWYKAGPAYYASYLKMQWGTIWYQLTLRSSSSALIRVSAESPGPDDDEAVVVTLQDFATRAIPAITAALP